jgi:hypothetical protein
VIRLRHIPAALAALCVLAAVPAVADASYRDVIKECYNTGALTPGRYTKDELKQARKHLPSDIREYSDCEDLINAELARLARANRGNGSGGSGGVPPAPPANPALTTDSGAVATRPEDFDALKHTIDPATRPSEPPEVAIANTKVSPTTGGLLGAARNASANSLPLPLILSLAALAAMAALGVLAVLRGRAPQIRDALRLLRR